MTREEMRQALNAAPTATHYWYWCTRLRETDRIADIWTVGPDSEAARAFRGLGSVAAVWRRLDKLAREVDAATTPNPNYTPAVRRVVAWEVTDTGDMHRDKRTAYRLAAHNRMTSGRESGRRAWRRFCEHPLGHKRERRKKLLRDRYAMMLHHWDEKAGHRA